MLKMFEYVHFRERSRDTYETGFVECAYCCQSIPSVLAEVIFPIAELKGHPHEYQISCKAMAFFSDQTLKATSSFSALGGSLVPSTMSQSC